MASLPSLQRSGGLFREERAALALVLAAHIALVAALTLLGRTPRPLPVPPRITVTLSNEVAPEASAPDRIAQATPEIAPTKGESPPEPAPPEPAPPPPALPQPAPPPPRPIPPRPAPPRPKPVVQPAPRPAPAKIAPARPAPAPARPAPAKPALPGPAPKVVTPPRNAPRLAAPGDERPRRRPDAPIGAGRIGADFAKGLPSDARPAPAAAPAAAITAAAKAGLASAIAEQLRPKWSAPQGVDAEKLITVLAWDLNPDGTLSGRPRVVSQAGITDANRPQAARHAELAIRAVTLAAPFDLPAKYYSAWKKVSAFRFDRNLSQ